MERLLLLSSLLVVFAGLLWLLRRLLHARSERRFRASDAYKALIAKADRIADLNTNLEGFYAALKRGDRVAAAKFGHRAADRLREVEYPFLSFDIRALAYKNADDIPRAIEAREEAIRRIPAGAERGPRRRLFSRQANDCRLLGWYGRGYENIIKAVEAIEEEDEEDIPFIVPAEPGEIIRIMEIIAICTGSAQDTSYSLTFRSAAQLAANQCRFAEAEQYALRAREESKNAKEEADAIETLGFIRGYEGRLEEALQLREGLIRENLLIPRSLFHAAHVLSHLGRWEESEQYYRKALDRVSDLSPMLEKSSRTLYRMGLARVRFEQGDFTEASELLQQALPGYSAGHRIERLCRIGLLQIAARTEAEPSSAIRILAKSLTEEIGTAIAEMPTLQDASRYYYGSMAILGRIFFDIGDVDMCEAILERFDPDNLLPVERAEYYYLCALCQERLGKVTEARTAFQSAAICPSEERHVQMARERLAALF